MRQLWEKGRHLRNENNDLRAVIKSYKVGDCELAQSLDSAIQQRAEVSRNKESVKKNGAKKCGSIAEFNNERALSNASSRPLHTFKLQTIEEVDEDTLT